MTGTPEEYFDAVYSAGPDPWGSRRWYEVRKRSLLLAALPEQRYRCAVEPGCGPGLLTADLAARCDSVLAIERSAVAACAARAATARLPGVEVLTGVVPDDWPDAVADLVVLSEIGYYTGLPDWSRLLDRAVAGLAAGGTLAAVHWRHPASDHTLTGDAVHAALRDRYDLTVVSSVVEHDLLLDVLVRAPRGTRGLSVAVRTGVPGAVA